MPNGSAGLPGILPEESAPGRHRLQLCDEKGDDGLPNR
jgi:hypothetical protein